MTKTEARLLREVHTMLRWIIIKSKIADCGHRPEERREVLALSAQLPRLPKSVVDYDKIGKFIFSDRKRGVIRTDKSYTSKDRFFTSKVTPKDEERCP